MRAGKTQVEALRLAKLTGSFSGAMRANLVSMLDHVGVASLLGLPTCASLFVDAADAAAICEAVRRPTMRFVRIKSTDQQCQLMQHRTRDLMMRQRTQLINASRAHLAELGIVAAMGDKGVTELLMIVADEDDGRLPVEARASLALLAAQLNAPQMLIGVTREANQNAASRQPGEPTA